ncbi:MAG: hypothetical protein HRT61_20520 [Ekhidna sp.]|nr:hypothetical protein [Ekhidna sp.]
MQNLTKYAMGLILLACLAFSCTPAQNTAYMWRDLDHSRQLAKQKGHSKKKMYNVKTRTHTKKKMSRSLAKNR